MSEVAVLRAPGTIVFGEGSAEAVGDFARSFGRRVSVCTDARLAGSRQGHRIIEALRGAGLTVEVLAEAVPELPRDAVERATDAARRDRPDCIVGVGGGSCIDMAKLVALGLVTDDPLEQLYGESRFAGPTVPVIAVPTTAGTGSEVTPVAVLGDPAIELKVGISSTALIPRVAICDPSMTLGAPPALTAHAGIDALAHAIEAYCARRYETWEEVRGRVFVGGNVMTDALSLRAIEKISGHLAAASSDEPPARAEVLQGSLWAGLAFGSAGTAAAHALQYPLGAATNTPHGLGVGLLLPYVMRFNASVCGGRLAEIAAAMGRRAGADAAIERVRELGEELGIPSSLAAIGVDRRLLPRMAEQAVGVDRLVRNNPRELSVADAVGILDAAWHGDVDRVSP